MKKYMKNSILILFLFGLFAIFGNTAFAASPSIISSKATPSKTDAVLEGVVNPNGYLATVWFEYGTKENLMAFSETVHMVIGSTTFDLPFSGNILNLTPDTTYYFRVVSDNARGTKKGNITSFITGSMPKNSETTTIIENKTEVIIVENISRILKIETTKNNISVGDEVDYIITFNNVTNENLKDIKISIELPDEIDFIESDFGKEEVGNVVTYNLDILPSSLSGSLKIKGEVNSKASSKDILVTTAILSYNTESSLDIKEIANTTNNIIQKDTNLGASTILAEKSFLPSTLTDWLILVLVIMCLLVVGRLIYKINSNPKPIPTPIPTPIAPTVTPTGIQKSS
jgi:hypothetical protein